MKLVLMNHVVGNVQLNLSHPITSQIHTFREFHFEVFQKKTAVIFKKLLPSKKIFEIIKASNFLNYNISIFQQHFFIVKKGRRKKQQQQTIYT
uniref:Uncharacterized protein n=1 Tax=Panagrolaimus sp. ES5 TaxID=591445 RepID=A0AC34G962_9BILA